MDSTRPRVGISACLLGAEVRFDGGHKKNAFIRETLGRFVDFVPVCPEVESGMAVPREPLRLVSAGEGVRLVGTRSGEDRTDPMVAWADRKVDRLSGLHLDGFILKKDSPSCGLERVRIHSPTNDRPPTKKGRGLFAEKLRERLPNLPLTEEGWLCDPLRRQSFLHAIFTHRRMREELLERPSAVALVTFHSDHKLLYMAHSPAMAGGLGRIVAGLASMPIEEVVRQYEEGAMAVLERPATPGKQANVLEHILGYFKTSLTPFEKQEMASLIEDFRVGIHGLLVPLTLLIHHLYKHGPSEWLRRQHYFRPVPKELAA